MRDIYFIASVQEAVFLVLIALLHLGGVPARLMCAIAGDSFQAASVVPQASRATEGAASSRR